jgi:hypothetical protein
MPLPWLIGSQDGRFRVEGNVHHASWQKLTASFAHEAGFANKQATSFEDVKGNIDTP